MFEDLFYDPTGIYICTYCILWCFVYTEYSFALNLIENVDWFRLYCWRQARQPLNFIGTQWPVEAWASADVAENQMSQVVELHYMLSRNFKRHHNLQNAFYVSLTQICMSPALNCVSLFIINITFYDSILGATELWLMITLMNNELNLLCAPVKI